MAIVIDKNLPDTAMPQYQCHKKVRALKIAAIEFRFEDARIAPQDNGYAPFEVRNYRSKFKGFDNDSLGKDLGYYVQYDDGYQSWSPTKAFEEGYTKI